LPRLFDLASLFLIVQSEALITNLLWISTCNLFASVANCSEQSGYQNCNIVGQYCNVARKRTFGLTVKCHVWFHFRLGSSPSFQGLKIAMHASGEKRRENMREKYGV
jgi:hypothetical protein